MGGAFCFGYWKAGFSEWANLGPLLLRTQLIVLHGVRSTSFVGASGPRFSANTDSKPPTQRAAMAQQIRLSAPRNISSLKLRDLPALNIVAPQAPYLQKSLNRSCDLSRRGKGTSRLLTLEADPAIYMWTSMTAFACSCTEMAIACG